MDFRIGVAEPDQYAALGELTYTAYADVLPAQEWPRFDLWADELRDVEARAKDADVLVAVDVDGSLLGGVTYVPGPESSWAEFTEPAFASFRQLAVGPAAQGRGVGAALVQACIDRAAAAGKTQLVLHSTEWMGAAHRLYERMGFTRDPAMDWEPNPGFWLRGFRLAL
jgi:GNAT superfamily N-acetyltransferase